MPVGLSCLPYAEGSERRKEGDLWRRSVAATLSGPRTFPCVSTRSEEGRLEMRSRTMSTAVAILTLLVGALMPAFALASTSSPYTRQIASAGTTSFRSTSEGTGELLWPELPVTVPSCLDDAATQRWFQVVLTLEVFPHTGDFTGRNTLYIAVSQTSSPLGSWTIYHLPVTDDGTEGTPDHHCAPYPLSYKPPHP